MPDKPKSNISELSLWLDSYDDIFSDFDSRNYLKRRISEDLIDELRASLKYKKSYTDDLVLQLPGKMRLKDIEREMISNIKGQLHNRFEMLKEKEKGTFTRGLLFLVAGVIIITINSLIAFNGMKSYPFAVLKIILEPASWFLTWNGLDILIYDYRKAKQETTFFSTIDRLHIHFKDLES
jgi:hypothetical protein